MKGAGSCVIAAVILTLPVYIGIANIPWINDWFMSGAGWDEFEFIFRVFNVMGISENGKILIGVMLGFSFPLSFVMSFVVTWAGSKMFGEAR